MNDRKRQDLTPDFVWTRFDCDYDVGILRWRDRPREQFADQRAYNTWNARYAGEIAGTINLFGYVQIAITTDAGKHFYKAHVLIWAHRHGEWRPGEVDHINGDRADNRICNLRVCTGSENGYNRALSRNNTSGHTGVWFDARLNKWCARIVKNYRTAWERWFSTVEEAVEARREALTAIAGEFAPDNANERPRYTHARNWKK